MKFEDYHITQEIKLCLAKKGYKRPTDIQFKSIPHIIKGEDLLAIAQTGTGKTAAFVIPILDKLQRKKKKGRGDGIKCLVMVPTRELAIQICEEFIDLGKHTGVKAFALHGGVDQDPQIAKLQSGIDVLISTPGRMFDLRSQGHIDFGRVEVLVLDEADHMLEKGFYKDIVDLIKFLPKDRQTLYFSATIDKKIKKLAYSLVKNPIRIQLSPKDPVSNNVDHYVVKVEMDDKRFFLERMIKDNPESKILVFVRTKVRAERVMKAMERVGLATRTMHGDKNQGERMKSLGLFKQGEFMVMIATDITARGIDIPNVEYVVNYDLPEIDEFYVHRVGRTGRGKNRGIAYSFCSPEEEELLEQIEYYLGKEIKEMEITKDAYSEVKDLSMGNELTMDKIVDMVTKENKRRKK
jgi:ATP-dependent RNA helicase RhlE